MPEIPCQSHATKVALKPFLEGPATTRFVRPEIGDMWYRPRRSNNLLLRNT